MAEEPAHYAEIRARISERYQRRKTFITEGGGFLLGGIVVLILWLVTIPEQRTMNPFVFLAICGGMFVGFLEKLVNLVLGELEDRAVEQAIEREREHQLVLAEKTKNDDLRYVRLSGDGELVEMDEFEADARKAKREEF